MMFTVVTLLALTMPRTATAAEVSFLRDVAPILATRCTGCHGDKKAEGDYRLHTLKFLRLAGASEQPAIVPGKPEQSELFLRITETDMSARMPVDDDPLSAAQIDIIRRWIAGGAKFDGRDEGVSFKSQMPARQHPASPETYRHAAPVFALALSPDGKEIATSGYHEVNLWNAADGKLVRRIGGMPQRIQALAYNQAGTQLLVGGGSPGDYGELAVVDLKQAGTPTVRVVATFEDLVLGVAWSRHEQWLAAAAADRTVRMFQAKEGKPLWESRLHSDFATAVSFSHDDRFLASSSKDCTIKVLEAESGKLFTTFNGHQINYGPEAGRFDVLDVTFAADAPQAFSVGEGRSLRIWEPEKAKSESGDARDMEERFRKEMHTKFVPHGSQRPAFKVRATKGQVFVATGDGLVKQFETTTLASVRDYAGHAGWIFSLDVHPATNRVAAGAHNGEVRVWNSETGALVTTFQASPGFVGRTGPQAGSPR